MGFPTTLFGVFGFIIATIFLIAMSASDLYPDETAAIESSQAEFIDNLNQTANSTVTPTAETGFWGTIFGLTGLEGIYTFVTNILSMGISFMIMIVQYILLFFGIAVSIPAEFYLLFVLMGMSAIVAIIKLFLWGE